MADSTSHPKYNDRKSMVTRDTEAMDRTVKEFGRCSLALCKKLSDQKALTEVERLFIDNHLQLLHMTYAKWKRETGAD
jgi:hypothetical protein